MSKQILVNASPFETRVANLENGEIKQLHIEREEDKNVVGNIYKGVVKRVLPGMQAAFLELGLERTAFLYVDDIIEEPLGTDVEFFEEEEGDQTSEFSEEELDGEPAGSPTEASTAAPATAPTEEAGGMEPFIIPSLKDNLTAEEAEEELEIPSEVEEEGEEGDLEDEEVLEAEGEEAQGSEAPVSATPATPSSPETAPAAVGVEGNRAFEEGIGGPILGPGLGGDPRPRPPQYRDRGPDYREGNRDRDQNRDRDRGGPRYESRGREGSGGGRSRNDRNDRDRNRGGRYGRDNRGGRGGRGRMPRGGRRGQSSRRARGSARIEDLLTEGQELLVQVAKAPIGTKGARLTTHISLPGRNLVLMPTVKHVGISRKIESDRERRRLRDLFMRRIRPRDVGFIIRTVADGKSYRDIKADADYLMGTWQRIKRDAQKKRAPALIHEDLSLAMRSVRDLFTDDIDSFIIDNQEEFENVSDFITQFMPRLKPRMKLFKGPSQLFEHYGIEAEISRALGKKVWLKSGGYLLIDQSEALTSIDVNTGRYVGSKSLEETILKTNLEAVREIAYQLRIRNVGGIIIIDLIDMESHDNRDKVYGALQDALTDDKSKTNILKISELGLVEMTRKRTHEDLVRYLTEACPTCDGRGYTKSKRTVCFEIFREIEKEALNANKNIVVFAHPTVVDVMMKSENKHVRYLEEKFSKGIAIKPDPLFHCEQYEVFGKH